MPEKSELRVSTADIFLREFVRHVIVSYKSIKGQPQTHGWTPLARLAPEIPSIMSGRPMLEGVKVEAPKPQLENDNEMRPSIITPGMAPSAPGESAIHKIRHFIVDPSVTNIECAGAGKPIMIRQNGRVIPTGIILSEQEIGRIMNEFSEKTRIPLIKGVFKAMLSNFIITAVVSDYVGTRFVIQRVNPMYQY